MRPQNRASSATEVDSGRREVGVLHAATDMAKMSVSETRTALIGLTRHKISCREPSVHESQDTLTTADTKSANDRLARGQLHRLVRWFSRGRILEPRIRTAPVVIESSGERQEANHRHQRSPKPELRRSNEEDVPVFIQRVHVPSRNIRCHRADGCKMLPPGSGSEEPASSESGESLRHDLAALHHLTSHKISCREPSVHEPQHTLTMADTRSVNGRLARGQLHRLVRPHFHAKANRLAKPRADTESNSGCRCRRMLANRSAALWSEC